MFVHVQWHGRVCFKGVRRCTIKICYIAGLYLNNNTLNSILIFIYYIFNEVYLVYFKFYRFVRALMPDPRNYNDYQNLSIVPEVLYKLQCIRSRNSAIVIHNSLHNYLFKAAIFILHLYKITTHSNLYISKLFNAPQLYYNYFLFVIYIVKIKFAFYCFLLTKTPKTLIFEKI